MSIAAPETDEERRTAAMIEEFFQSGWDEALNGLEDKMEAKRTQLVEYMAGREGDDEVTRHARHIASGRIEQIDQVAAWIRELRTDQ